MFSLLAFGLPHGRGVFRSITYHVSRITPADRVPSLPSGSFAENLWDITSELGYPVRTTTAWVRRRRLLPISSWCYIPPPWTGRRESAAACSSRCFQLRLVAPTGMALRGTTTRTARTGATNLRRHSRQRRLCRGLPRRPLCLGLPHSRMRSAHPPIRSCVCMEAVARRRLCGVPCLR